MADTKKYYWLKLKNDFFKRHDIKIIEAMENGKDYVLFYMKLLLESVDHEGELRFSETVPYNDKMLATITDTNIDIVRSAVKVFSEFGMMEQFDDGTLYMLQVEKMLGSETNDAVRMRKAREKQKQLEETHTKSEQCSKSFKNRSPEIEIELEKDIELDKEKEEKKCTTPKPSKKIFEPPTEQEVINYAKEKGYILDAQYFFNYYTTANWLDVKGEPVKNWKLKMLTWNNREEKNNPTRPKPFKKVQNMCKKCGKEVIAGVCTGCGALYDSNGNIIEIGV